MPENIELLIAFYVGLVLGVLFFYGLWLTLKKIIYSDSPGLWLVISGFLRLSLVVAGLYYVIVLSPEGRLVRIFLYLIGLIMGRILISKVVKKVPTKVSYGA